jgi:hypothetical protein
MTLLKPKLGGGSHGGTIPTTTTTTWWWMLGVWCLASIIHSPNDNSNNNNSFKGGVAAQFLTPDGERREPTFQVLEFEDGLVNQKFDGMLRYYCTFRGKWSKERHPNDFPKSPSYSAPVMISHSNGYRMWTGTEAATLGVESIAEVRSENVNVNVNVTAK